MLVLLGPRLSASPVPTLNDSQKQSCTACIRCQCCVKEAPSAPAPPLNVPASTRTALQTDIQLLLAVSVLLAPLTATPASSIQFLSSISLPAGAPLYERHCAYLI